MFDKEMEGERVEGLGNGGASTCVSVAECKAPYPHPFSQMSNKHTNKQIQKYKNAQINKYTNTLVYIQKSTSLARRLILTHLLKALRDPAPYCNTHTHIHTRGKNVT